MGSGAGLEVEGLHLGVFGVPGLQLGVVLLTGGLLRLPESTSLCPNSDIIQFGGLGWEGGCGAQGLGLAALGLVWEFGVEGLRVYSRRGM